MNLLIVGGSFNDDGGKPSGWVSKFASVFDNIEFDPYHPELGLKYKTTLVNGGTWELLTQQIDKLPEQGIVCWLADIPNDKPKIVDEIKKKHPKLLLVTSKRNLDGTYSVHDLISRALAVKANLTLEFTGDRSGVQTTILDPLGNVFLTKETSISNVVWALCNRLDFLRYVKRIGSKQIGEAIPVPNSPSILEFIEIVKVHAIAFHDIIHPIDTTRMLGNASFRCESGFPSFNFNGLIFVSRRNMDKRLIGIDSFVSVQMANGVVEYYGDNKPSVDSPVQLALYKMYPNIRFMLHSHTYINGAPFTKEVLPCGAIEEANQIWSVVSNRQAEDFYVNIKGHGSICFARTLGFLKSVPWISRPIPETH